jgi:hypothetical protein
VNLSTELSFTGGCLCGAVRYEVKADPIFSINCHCLDCQKTTGGGYAPILMVPLAALTVKGQVQYYSSLGDTGQPVERGFCSTCGSPLFGKPTVLSGMLGIKAASLDEPSRYQPSADMYTDSAQDWDCMDPKLPKFAKAPPG